MRKQFRAIIVDDERLARRELHSILSELPEIRIIGEADNVTTAVELIESSKPDVLFLDIQMPGESGFDLISKIEGKIKVIFVTAFDEYAIRAFEVNALDYLLKPINPDRLSHTIGRLSANEITTSEKDLKKLEYDDRLFLTIDSRSTFLKISTIESICAAGDYSEIFSSDSKKSLVLKSLKEWEERLPEKYFARIHRSTIINFEYVDRVEKWFNNSYQVFLRNIEKPFIMSRRYAVKVKDKLK